MAAFMKVKTRPFLRLRPYEVLDRESSGRAGLHRSRKTAPKAGSGARTSWDGAAGADLLRDLGCRTDSADDHASAQSGLAARANPCRASPRPPGPLPQTAPDTAASARTFSIFGAPMPFKP
jgi:hypothetical protein